MRNLKSMGLALVAILAMSAMGAAAAQADEPAEFWGLSGTELVDLEAEGSQNFTTSGKSVTCKELDGHAVYEEEAGTLTGTDPSFTECNTVILGFINPTTVQTAEGCHFTFTAGTYTEAPDDADGAAHICAVTLTQYTNASHTTVYCQIHVPSQTVEGVTYANAEGSVTVDVDAEVDATVTDHDKTGCTTHEGAAGNYTGSFRAIGTEDPAAFWVEDGTTQIDVEAEGDQLFTTPGKMVTCKKLDGHAAYSTETATLTGTDPGFTECNTVILGFINVPTTVETAPNCHFTFTAGEYTEASNDADGSVHICAITITQYTSAAHSTLYCQQHVPAQTVGGVTYTNVDGALTADVNASVQATVTDLDKVGCSTHETVNATYTGSIRALGTKEEDGAFLAENGTVQTDLEAEGDQLFAYGPTKLVTCERLDGHAQYSGETKMLTGTDVGFTECNTDMGIFNLATTVQTAEGCHFTFTAGTYTAGPNDAEGSVHICATTITQYTDGAHSAINCQIHIPAQTVAGLTYTNAMRGGRKAVTVDVNASVQATVTDLNKFLCDTHDTVNATYAGTFWAYGTNAEEELTDIEVRGEVTETAVT